ncbi:MAG: hypothetical protein ACK51D_10375 [Cyclobacteriaceae bacterium]
MELLEIQDPEKKRLIEESERHKRELDREVGEFSDRTERVVKNALVIGGALALSYFLFTQFSGKKKKTKPKKQQADRVSAEVELEEPDQPPSFLSKVGTQVMSQATVMLLALAKEILAEHLQSRKEKHEYS